MVKINPKSKIWFLTRIGKDIEWRIEKRKRICLQNLILSRSEREFFSKSRISRGEREFFLQNLDIREHLEKWKFNSPARDRKKWTISSQDFLEIENLVNAWLPSFSSTPLSWRRASRRPSLQLSFSGTHFTGRSDFTCLLSAVAQFRPVRLSRYARLQAVVDRASLAVSSSINATSTLGLLLRFWKKVGNLLRIIVRSKWPELRCPSTK